MAAVTVQAVKRWGIPGGTNVSTQDKLTKMVSFRANGLLNQNLTQWVAGEDIGLTDIHLVLAAVPITNNGATDVLFRRNAQGYNATANAPGDLGIMIVGAGASNVEVLVIGS